MEKFCRWIFIFNACSLFLFLVFVVVSEQIVILSRLVTLSSSSLRRCLTALSQNRIVVCGINIIINITININIIIIVIIINIICYWIRRIICGECLPLALSPSLCVYVSRGFFNFSHCNTKKLMLILCVYQYVLVNFWCSFCTKSTTSINIEIVDAIPCDKKERENERWVRIWESGKSQLYFLFTIIFLNIFIEWMLYDSNTPKSRFFFFVSSFYFKYSLCYFFVHTILFIDMFEIKKKTF